MNIGEFLRRIVGKCRVLRIPGVTVPGITLILSEGRGRDGGNRDQQECDSHALTSFAVKLYLGQYTVHWKVVGKELFMLGMTTRILSSAALMCFAVQAQTFPYDHVHVNVPDMKAAADWY